jgi:hypothetical protein
MVICLMRMADIYIKLGNHVDAEKLLTEATQKAKGAETKALLDLLSGATMAYRGEAKAREQSATTRKYFESSSNRVGMSAAICQQAHVELFIWRNPGRKASIRGTNVL